MNVHFLQRKGAPALIFSLLMFFRQTTAGVKIDVDCVNFLKGANQSEIILYYQITSDREKPAKHFDWNLNLKLTIMKTDSAWLSRDWDLNVPIDLDTTRQTRLQYIGRIAFEAEPDQYQANLSVTDKTFEGESDSRQTPFAVQSQSILKPGFSDILLASSIINENPVDAQNPFIRNGLLVMPKPDCVYRDFDPNLFYYVETYNLLKKSDPQDYLFQSVITKTDGSVVKKSKIKKYPKDQIQDAMATFEEISIAGIDSGVYQIQIALYDSNRIEVAHQSKRFSVVKSSPHTVSDSNMAILTVNNPFVSMNQDEFEEELKSLKYVLTSNEQLILKSLKDDAAKKQFLFNYWLSKDVARSSPQNAFYDLHKQRVQTANLNFKAFTIQGWKTDRGRIYIQYGQPDNIERFQNSLGRIPYEIWYFDNIESGVEFVFADIGGDNNYTLIHSTKIGEVYNPNYESLLQRVRSNSDSDIGIE